MGEMTGEELSAMTDHELLVYQRDHHGDPYMTLAKAKEMQRMARQFCIWGSHEEGRPSDPGTGAASPS